MNSLLCVNDEEYPYDPLFDLATIEHEAELIAALDTTKKIGLAIPSPTRITNTQSISHVRGGLDLAGLVRNLFDTDEENLDTNTATEEYIPPSPPSSTVSPDVNQDLFSPVCNPSESFLDFYENLDPSSSASTWQGIASRLLDTPTHAPPVVSEYHCVLLSSTNLVDHTPICRSQPAQPIVSSLKTRQVPEKPGINSKTALRRSKRRKSGSC